MKGKQNLNVQVVENAQILKSFTSREAQGGVLSTFQFDKWPVDW